MRKERIRMSYYSKVAYIFRAKDEPNLVQAMRQWDAEHPESYEKAFDLFSHADEKTISSDGKYLLVYWNYLKWYYESNDVAFFVERLPNLDIPYDFIRLGEEIGDCEQEENLCACLISPDQAICISENF